ncbi:carboxypeptidase-like regulatory domain-containing protein [Chromobacterium paludis]|uniref:Carboxypeptidase regulatory-like domain-containing protein n=1 Tax=Chromobacterium paludis TaxID=2605945 RepID=A0A5C1DGI2_9NEIS|nr:carboxypeptidase-like regulatory domain-containing protein [Chromobacterium paludis]QEL55764.1 carboxypeptidase regulatory-like domain-containing protein [Chromobacterium paludis]
MNAKLSPIALACMLLLSACGGGSDNNNANTSANTNQLSVSAIQNISGTVATGSPMANAQITVKNAQGQVIKSLQTDANGSFSNINIGNATGPLLLEASGVVNGSPLLLHSVATSNGVVNITPLTEAIVTLTSGNNAGQCFAQADKCAQTISADALKQSQANLKTALSPLSQALALDDQSDWISTAFTPNKTGHDKLLELVDISAGDKPGSIVVKSKLGGTAVSVSRQQKPAQISIPAGGAPDIAGLDILAAQLTDAYKTADGQSGRIGSLLSKDFNYSGANASQFLAQLNNRPTPLVGVRFGQPKLLNCESANRCEVVFTINEGAERENYIVSREGNQWKIAGDDYPVDMSIMSESQAFHQIDRKTLKNSVNFSVDFQLAIGQWPLGNNSPTPTVRSAQMLVNGQPLLSLAEDKTCGSNLLVDTQHKYSMGGKCSFSFYFPNNVALQINQAMRTGQVKVRLFSQPDFTQALAKDITVSQPVFLPDSMDNSNYAKLDDASISTLSNANLGSDITLSWKQPSGIAPRLLEMTMYGVSQPRYESITAKYMTSDPASPAKFSGKLSQNKQAGQNTYTQLSLNIYGFDRYGRNIWSNYSFN